MSKYALASNLALPTRKAAQPLIRNLSLMTRPLNHDQDPEQWYPALWKTPTQYTLAHPLPSLGVDATSKPTEEITQETEPWAASMVSTHTFQIQPTACRIRS